MTCDQTNIVPHVGNQSDKDTLGYFRNLMVILWITSLHLLKIFDCKYNTEIKVSFFSDELLCLTCSPHLTAQLSFKLPHSHFGQRWVGAELSQALAIPTRTKLCLPLNISYSYYSTLCICFVVQVVEYLFVGSIALWGAWFKHWQCCFCILSY